MRQQAGARRLPHQFQGGEYWGWSLKSFANARHIHLGFCALQLSSVTRMGAPSRGELVAGFVRSCEGPEEYLGNLNAQVSPAADRQEETDSWLGAKCDNGPWPGSRIDAVLHSAAGHACRPSQASTCWWLTLRSSAWPTCATRGSAGCRRSRPACTASLTATWMHTGPRRGPLQQTNHTSHLECAGPSCKGMLPMPTGG